MSDTIIIGIDPGASGGIAIIYPDQKVHALGMPDDADLLDVISNTAQLATTEGARVVAYLELVGGYIAGNPAPGSAMFNFGSGWGYIRGLLAAYRIRTELVRPQQWQAGIPGVKGAADKTARKRSLKEHAARLHPTVKVTLKTADALLLADYGRRKEAGL